MAAYEYDPAAFDLISQHREQAADLLNQYLMAAISGFHAKHKRLPDMAWLLVESASVIDVDGEQSLSLTVQCGCDGTPPYLAYVFDTRTRTMTMNMTPIMGERGQS